MEIKLCEYGCGQEAKHQLKNGRWCCEDFYTKCPENRRKNSERVKQAHKEGRCVSSQLEKGWGWNRGLSKETSTSMMSVANTLHNKYFNKEFFHPFLGKHHTEESKKKMKNNGGYRKHSGRGKQGWYKGYECDSSWELAWVIYNLDHEIKFERNRQGFQYEFKGKIFKFYPDFILEDGSYVEIKGWLDEKNKAKIASFPQKISVLGKKEITPFLKYTEAKYGKDFVSLYENSITPKVKVCPDCGVSIGKNSLKCSKCAKRGSERLNLRKIIRPTREELENLIKSLPMTQIGKKFGVSDNAIRKWAKAYGL